MDDYLTDLMKAIKRGSVNEVKKELQTLLDNNNKGELEKIIPHSGDTALFLAITYSVLHHDREEGNEIVRVLIDDGKMNLRHKTKGNEWTPIFAAAYHNNPAVIKMIWHAAGSADILRDKNVDGDCILHTVAFQGDDHLETAKTILRIAPDLRTCRNKKDVRPLDVAVERNNKKMADLLSSSKFDADGGGCCAASCVIQ